MENASNSSVYFTKNGNNNSAAGFAVHFHENVCVLKAICERSNDFHLSTVPHISVVWLFLWFGQAQLSFLPVLCKIEAGSVPEDKCSLGEALITEISEARTHTHASTHPRAYTHFIQTHKQ